MKTASLGLLEVMVVRVNAGGDAPRTPPLLVVTGPFPLSLFSSRKDFWRISGKIYLAGWPLRYNYNPNKQMAGLVPLVCTWERDRQNNENGFARAFGGDGGTCECRGGCPPGPPLCGDVMGPSHFLCFLQEQIFGEWAGNFFGELTVKVQLQETTSNKWRA